jgi:hypothetical protein
MPVVPQALVGADLLGTSARTLVIHARTKDSKEKTPTGALAAPQPAIAEAVAEPAHICAGLGLAPRAAPRTSLRVMPRAASRAATPAATVAVQAMTAIAQTRTEMVHSRPTNRPQHAHHVSQRIEAPVGQFTTAVAAAAASAASDATTAAFASSTAVAGNLWAVCCAIPPTSFTPIWRSIALDIYSRLVAAIAAEPASHQQIWDAAQLPYMECQRALKPLTNIWRLLLEINSVATCTASLAAASGDGSMGAASKAIPRKRELQLPMLEPYLPGVALVYESLI